LIMSTKADRHDEWKKQTNMCGKYAQAIRGTEAWLETAEEAIIRPDGTVRQTCWHCG
jgi:hypothetical protein